MTSTGCVFALDISVRHVVRLKFHSHNCTELIFILKGKGHLVTPEKECPYGEGSLIIYQPGAKHADRASEDGLQFCLGAQGPLAACLPSGVWKCGDAVRSTVNDIRELLPAPDSRMKAMEMDILAGELCRRIARDTSLQEIDPPESEDDLCERARQKLDKHVNSSYSIDRLGEDIFISQGYLRKLFKERYGESPITYLLRRKLELAEEMLKMTDCPVKEIAAKVGIGNPYYFSALFRRKKGLSPAKYRLAFGVKEECPAPPPAPSCRRSRPLPPGRREK